MKATLISIVALITSGCVVHAHPHPHSPPPAVHKPVPPVVRHVPHPAPVKVKAWVWVKGHRNARGVWTHGYWDLRTVPRHMINRHPHTYVRQVRGRGRPAPPPRRYR
jgi:hypothetical protein